MNCEGVDDWEGGIIKHDARIEMSNCPFTKQQMLPSDSIKWSPNDATF
jgi:hypothetical protein